MSSFGYNGLGHRLSQTVNGNTTNFTLDINSNLAQVLSDGANSYIYGLGRIAQVQGGATEYFLADALGSARQLTDQNGSVSYSSTFDPFGAQTQSAGTVQTPYGFTGEYTTNGLIHLRAREYAPGMGRFLTRDPFAGNAMYPASFNGYSYAGNNPVLYTDPSGECFDPITLFICVAAAGALIGGGVNLYAQLHNNGGNWDCVDWGQVVAYGGAGAVAGAIGAIAFPVFLPATGATLVNFMIAGGLSSIVAGQAARSSYLLFSGKADQIISSFARPEDVLHDFGWGVVGGAVGYGLQSLVRNISYGLRISVGVPDEFASPIQTGQWRNWSAGQQAKWLINTKTINPKIINMDNCVNCAFAMDQSLSGKLTSALPSLMKRQEQVIREFTPYYGGTDAESMFFHATNPSRIASTLRQSGDGARGLVMAYPQTGPGHAFNVINDNGVILAVDSQRGYLVPFEIYIEHRFTEFRFLFTGR